MAWLSEQWLQLAFVVGYLAILAHHARVGQKTVHSLPDYLVAGRNLGGWVVALSFYATFMSTNTFIGAAGKSWDVGLAWNAGTVVLVGLCCVSWFVVAPRFVPLTRQYGSLTVADFLGFHYRSMAVRKTAAVIVLLSSIVYLVAIYQGAAIAVQMMMDMPYGMAAGMVFLIVTSYTLAGGFRSVVLTDALQGTIMVGGAVALVTMVLLKGHGLGNILDTVAQRDPALVSWPGKMPFLTIIGLALAVGIKYLVEPRQLSRFYGLRDQQALRQAALIAPCLVLVTYLCLMPLGALAHALIPAQAISSSDEVVPYLLSAQKLFGPVLSSLFLLVLVSAAMSSIDSVLLVAASSVDHDLIAPEAVDAGAIRRTRIWVVLISLVSLGGALNPYTSDIVTLTSFSGSLYGACFFPALVLGLFWRSATAAGALSCLLGGSLVVVGWFIARRLGWTGVHEVYAGLAAGVAIYAVVGWLTRPARGAARRPA